MTKKITLGCSNRMNLISFLREDFNIVQPYLLIKDTEVIKNFDILFIFDSGYEDIFKMCNHFNIPTIGSWRQDKFDQMIRLKSLNIPHPPLYKIIHEDTDDERSDSLYLLLKNIPDEEKFIMKAENGARGIGQALLNKNEMYSLIDDIYDSNIETKTLIEKYNIGGIFKNEHEEEAFRTFIEADSFHIQKFINIEEEYRFIYFYDEEPIIVQRNKNKEGWQSNISVTGSGSQIKFDKRKHNILIEWATKLANDMNVPFLSIDVYKDRDGNYGIFEYQMQMGYKIPSKTEIVQKTISSVQKYIEDNI